MALIQYVAKLAVDKDTGLPLPELQGQGGMIIARGNPSVIPTIYEDKDGALPIPGSVLSVDGNGFVPSFWVDDADLPISWWNGATEAPLESVEGVQKRLDDLEVEFADMASQANAASQAALLIESKADAAVDIATDAQNTANGVESIALDAKSSATAAGIAAADAAASVEDALSTATRADDVGYDVVALLGQSNMVGRAVLDIAQPPNPRVMTFPARGDNANRIIPASEPQCHWGIVGEDSMGPGTTFAEDYLGMVPSNRKVLLVPAAMGATGFSAGVKRWRKTHTPDYDNLYLLALRQIRNALQAAGPNARLVGCLWHQGEGDPGNATYADELDGLIAGIREEFDVPDMWFLVGQMSPAGNVLSASKVATNAVHVDTPRRVYRTAFAPVPYGAHKPGDTTHFSAVGQRYLGHSYGEALRLALANVPGEPPIAPTNLRAAQGDPGIVTIQWDRPKCRFTDFLVQYRDLGETEWATWAHTASLDNKARLSTQTAATEVRVATVNEEGTSEFGPVVTVEPTPWPAEAAPAAPWRAYSLRKVIPEYEGNCIEVRRSSDDALQDIGFTPEGLLDEDALRAFCGSGDGYVARWWDQGGAGSLVGGTTNANQPKIVTGGVVHKEGGRPVVTFDGTDDYMFSSTVGLLAGPGMTASLVAHPTNLEAGGRLFAEGSDASISPMYTWMIRDSKVLSTQFRTDANDVTTVDGSNPIAYDCLQSFVFTDDKTKVRAIGNEFVEDPIARVQSGTATVRRFSLGAMVRTTVSNFQAMTISEALFWQAALGPADLEALYENQREHFTLSRTGVPAA